jgi:hypothetical protein
MFMVSLIESAHARLGPSSAHRWARCPASIRLAEQVPARPAGAAAAAGTLLHTVFERQMLGQSHLHAHEIELLAEFDVGEMRARMIVDQAVRAARSAMSRYQLTEFLLESRVDPGQTMARTDYWGTADLIAANADTRTLLVGDLKTGRGRVDAEANDQLLSYALGALELMAFEPQRIVLAIFQPVLLGDRPALWETGLDTLYLFRSYIAERAAMTDREGVEPEPSDEACQWCPARSICPAWVVGES